MNTVELEELGVLSALDRKLGAFLGGDEEGGLVALAAALVSRSLREGHVCLELARVAEESLVDQEGRGQGRLPSFTHFRAALEGSDAVQIVDAGRGHDNTESKRPLVLDSAGRLYFRRYFEHERRLARALIALESGEGRGPRLRAPVPKARLDHYFGLQTEPDLQRRAAELALEHDFSIISGGPGTGKTATVVKILALLAEQAASVGQPLPKALLLAPTGKAAARLKESIALAKDKLGASPEVLAAIAGEASTIHRALGVLPRSRTRFRRTAQNPLPADLVLVDEASMVDLSLMRQLVDALGPGARLVLLGDRYQLASVQAGSVLGELCAAFGSREGGAESAAVVELRKSYRFTPDSGIFRLAEAVRAGEGRRALELLDVGLPDLEFQAEQAKPEDRAALRRIVVAGFERALRAPTPEAALGALGGFRVLAAHRRGPFGVEALNELCRSWLGAAALLPEQGEFYRGRPLLITENDYSSGLYNGDVGLIWPDEEGRLVAFFEGPTGLRRFSPAHLPDHETAFAITIHKSQGSEYDEVAIVLPDAGSALLSRELLYTAVTRARRRVVVSSDRAAVEAACERSVARSSGLRDALAQLAWSKSSTD